MVMEVLRYIIVFLTVGWGGGLLGGLLTVLAMPLLLHLRGKSTQAAVAVATSNGPATLGPVVAAFYVCRWTGDDASYAMFALAFWAMVLNDRWRIRRAQSASALVGQVIDEEPNRRAGIVLTERFSFYADIVGFSCGLVIVPKLSFL